LRDADGDGRAEIRETYAQEYERPHGMVFHGGALYVGDLRGVWRIAYNDGDTRAPAGTMLTRPGAFLGGAREPGRQRLIRFQSQEVHRAIALLIAYVGSQINLGERANPWQRGSKPRPEVVHPEDDQPEVGPVLKSVDLYARWDEALELGWLHSPVQEEQILPLHPEDWPPIDRPRPPLADR